MKSIIDLLKEKILIFDGAMGTSIQNKGIDKIDFQGKECNEYINILNPRFIQEIHADFLKAGAQIIETNTFGALDYLLKEYALEDKTEEINRQAVRLALEIAGDFSDSSMPRFVSGSLGPGTKLPSLLQISFDELYANYFAQAECLISEGVHLIQIETGQDTLQMKIALKAVLDVKKKLKKDIPIFLQATMQENGQMLVGTDLLTFINTFKDMPVHGLGINCGTGPHHMENYLKILSENCPLNISLLPNAGLPVLQNGALTYDLSPAQFGETCSSLIKKYRINAIGGCCGTTHEFIKELSQRVSNEKPKECQVISHAYLTSLFSSQEIKAIPAPLLIGERANVNGSKKFKNLLNENNWEAMTEICITQQEEGAHVLDICLIHLERNEVEDMTSFIPLLNKNIIAPLMIDSTNFQAIETALKHTSGKVIVNSVNFENGEETVEKYIELCRNMNAALICLTIDEKGMAKTKSHKLKIVERFLSLCQKHSFPEHLIFIDCLTFALSTGDDEYRNAGKEAIETINYLSKNYPQLNTVMGVSNVSFGLKPKTRKILNSVFLHECIKNGLTAAIVDASKILPLNEIPEDEVKICLDLIYNNMSAGDPLIKLSELVLNTSEDSLVKENLSRNEQLYQSVIKGRSSTVQEDINELIKTHSPLEIVNTILISAMQEVGNLFEKGKIQLPFVLKSAEIMKKSVDFLKPYMSEQGSVNKESMLLATVQGDVHDIGKNLVQIILENNGYTVYDIGVKQSPHNIYQAIIENKPDCLGMSALLIKSTAYMKETLEYLKQKNIDIPVICGGAALNKEFVEKELQSVYNGKVIFGKDAFAGLKFIQDLNSVCKECISHSNTELIHKQSDTPKSEKISTKKQLNIKPVLPFSGNHPVKSYPFKNFKSWLNIKFLYHSLWHINALELKNNEELQSILKEKFNQMMSWAEEFTEPAYVYAYYPANSREDSIVIYHPDCNDCAGCSACHVISKNSGIAKIIFTGKYNGRSVSDAILNEKETEKDILAFQVVTLGKKAVDKANELKKTGQYQDYFYWHGFCSALTEALAAKVHSVIRVELGIEKADDISPEREFKQEYQGKRLSFGYEALPDLYEQNKILDLLKADEIGISLTDSGMLEPEFSTCALIFHRDV